MAKHKPVKPAPTPDPAPEPERTTELVNARVAVALMERARNAVWHIGRGKTLAALVTEGMTRVVEELEREHNDGKPFPQRTTELPKSSRKKRKNPPG